LAFKRAQFGRFLFAPKGAKMPPKIGKAATREEPPVAFQVPIENRESGHLILEEGEAIRKARMHSSCKPDKISPADRWGKEVSTGNSGEVL
jgi:hypothetical protein